MRHAESVRKSISEKRETVDGWSSGVSSQPAYQILLEIANMLNAEKNPTAITAYRRAFCVAAKAIGDNFAAQLVATLATPGSK